MNNGNNNNNNTQFLTMPQFPSPNTGNYQQHKMVLKPQWGNGNNLAQPSFNTSLLGIAAASIFSDRPFFLQQQQQPPQLQEQQRADAQAITDQVLQELAQDDLFAPPTDDLFDLEPVPLRETSAQVSSSQQQAPSRLALLESTLDQVLNDESDFFSMDAPSIAPPVAPLSAPPSIIQNESMKRSAPSSVIEQPVFKKQRMDAEYQDPIMDDDAAAAAAMGEERFRDYQSKQWSEKFQELMDFKRQRGHCCVPHTFKENPPLARWVKRQRYQYKLKNENKPSTMTDERILALEQMGFVWDSHGAAWEERWSELQDYRAAMGHCNVPSNYASNPQLATWVKCQRRQYKLFWDGKPSNMTLDRISKLEQLGFEWELRGPKKSKQLAAAAVAAAASIASNGNVVSSDNKNWGL